MTEIQKKLIRVMNELLHYYFDLSMNEISIQLLQGDNHSTVSLSGYPAIYENEELEKLKKTLNRPRQEELEEYYWNLIGSVDSSEQMNLVSMLIDSADVTFEDGKLTITAHRHHS